MSSMISIGVSFLLFFIVLGMMWLIGSNIVMNLIDQLPPLPMDSPWKATEESNIANIKLIITLIPAILILFASIKMLSNSTAGGRD